MAHARLGICLPVCCKLPHQPHCSFLLLMLRGVHATTRVRLQPGTCSSPCRRVSGRRAARAAEGGAEGVQQAPPPPRVARLERAASLPPAPRLGLLLLGAATALALPRGICALLGAGWNTAVADTSSVGLLYAYLLAVPSVWGRRARRLAAPLAHYGLRAASVGAALRQLGAHLAAGFALVAAVVAAPAPLTATGRLQAVLLAEGASAGAALQTLAPLLLAALALALVEEMLFRGLLADEAARDLSARGAPGEGDLFCGLVFAAVHLSLPAAPGLLALALALAALKRKTGRLLWAPIGLHAGLVFGYSALTTCGVVDAVAAVSVPWMSGASFDNPLAGAAGLAMAVTLYLYCQR